MSTARIRRVGDGVPAARRIDSDEVEQAFRRALELAKEALALIDEVDPASLAGVRGQHFIDELEARLTSE